MMTREVSERLLQLAADTPAGEGGHLEDLLVAVREWSATDGVLAADERRESDLQALELLVAAVDAARIDTHDGGIRWIAHVLQRLAAAQRICGDGWRAMPVRYDLERLADLAVDCGGFAVWAWQLLEDPEALASPAVIEALCRAARAAAEAHAALSEALAALDAAAAEWTTDREGASA